MSNFQLFLVAVGMAVVALLCRSSFLLPKSDLPVPHWLREGLRYAPSAALAALVAPEILMNHGHMLTTWKDARLIGAVAGLSYYVVRQSLAGTIVCGTGVMLVLRLGFGW